MTSIRLRSPGDVVAVLPYQLGYHPEDSLVVVALRDRAVVLIERLDLPTAADAEESSRVLVPPLLDEDPDATLLVAYETEPGRGRPALDALGDHLARAGLDVLDRMVVRGGRWYAVDCVTGRCPDEGSPVPTAADIPAVAEFVGLGIAPLAGRGALADLVAADPEQTAAVADLLAERGRRPPALGQAAARFEALSAWAAFLRLDGVDDGAGAPVAGGSAALRPDQVALLVRSLRDVELRDALVAWLCPGALPADCGSADLADAVRTCLGGARPDEPSVARRHLVRLQQLVRTVPDAQAAAPLTVLANLAWWLGDGALARTCLERALDASPGYRLALLLERMLDLGVRPGGRSARDERRAG